MIWRGMKIGKNKENNTNTSLGMGSASGELFFNLALGTNGHKL